jgi:hypothetical protein
MSGVYYFSVMNGLSLADESGNTGIENGFVSCPKNEMSVFKVLSPDKIIHFVTLTRDEALLFNVIEAGKQKIALLSGAMLLDRKNELRIQHDCNATELYTFPATDLFKGLSSFGTKKIFRGFHLRTEEKKIDISFREICPNRYTAEIPEWDTSQYKDMLLQVHYKGDIGNAFIDGDLIADNFWNGSVWEIGIREFAERLKSNPITFYITPLKKGAKLTVSGMAGQKEEVEESIGYIEKITARIIYEWTIAK